MTPENATVQFLLEEAASTAKIHAARVVEIRLQCHQRIQELEEHVASLEQQLEGAHRELQAKSEPCGDELSEDKMPETAAKGT